MKTNLDTTRHDYVGALESRKLTIEANGKAFKELISGIYSDKAYAIARETMANCVDSHVQAGTPDRPFDIKIPTHLEPEYLIRDYGVSMRHETVMDLYSTLFRSTKDDPNSDESNKFVGKFGLGSKSPFSYTDAFQLTAFLDGEARYYDISFNGGEPQTSLFMVQETEEENGILITFPVDPKDCADFERAIVRACEGLPVLPNFIGRKPSIPQRSVIRQGSRWKLLDSTATGRAEAKQGTVLYPLNKNAVIDCPVALHPLFEMTIHLEFPIGELDVTTSREALSYDEATSANIVRALEEVRDDIRANAVAKLRSATTYHEFNAKFAELKSRYKGPLWTLLDLVAETFEGKRPIEAYHVMIGDKVVIEREQQNINGEIISPIIHRYPRFGDLQFHSITTGLTTSYATIGRFKDDAYRRTITVDATVDEIVLVLEDETIRPRYTLQRLDILKRERRFYNKNVQVFWVRHSVDPTFAIKRLRAACGRAPVSVIHLKEIEYAPVRYDGYGESVYVPDDYKVIDYKGWSSPTGEAPEEAYYVCLYKGDVEGYSDLSCSNLESIKKHLVAIGEPDLPIVGIPKSRRSQIKKNPGWREFIPLAREVLVECIEKEKLVAFNVRELYDPRDIANKVANLKEMLGDQIFNPIVAGTSIDVMYQEIANVSEAMVQATKDPKNVISLLHKIGLHDIDVVDECMKEAKEIVERYEKACDRVNSDFGLLKHLALPRLPKAQNGKVVDLVKARERRLAILPFYVWLKTVRPVRETISHRVIGSRAA
ncbi:hypothetical protein [Sinorhizobium meliloti]|uniref:hypothetical protein n=1 Tax=Rhizobium meliloti TaxID=382 RepID=UPI001297F9C0|nr:hypothetical protein [Sinorhizobium meliloti]MDW9491741.1 hypothetical protein [Sinorhizobium meliloti]MQV03007.1 hypothetical protein [Sinorhizobium meliloti]